MISTDERARLRALGEAAMPGPWDDQSEDYDGLPVIWVQRKPSQVFNDPQFVCVFNEDGMPYERARENTAFIAAARTALPALLDQIDAAESRLAALEDAASRVVCNLKDMEAWTDLEDLLS